MTDEAAIEQEIPPADAMREILREAGLDLNEYGYAVQPRWRVVLANTIGWFGGKLLDLSYRLVDTGIELPVDGYVYRATPGFVGAFASLKTVRL